MLWQEHQKGDGHTQTHGVNLQRGALFMMSDDGPDMDAKDGAFKIIDVKSIFARQLCKNTNTIGSVLA